MFFVPCKRTVVSRKSNYIKCPYRVQRLICKKDAAWKVRHTFKAHESLESYKNVAHWCKFAISDFVISYENNLG
jgi:hypothetical protein